MCVRSLPLPGKEEKPQREAQEEKSGCLGRPAHEGTVAERALDGNVDATIGRE